MKILQPAITLLVAAVASSCQSTVEQTTTPFSEMAPEEAMAKWLEWSTPAEHHRHLDPLVGEFRAEIQSWMMPGSEPERSSGSMTNSWSLGGRFLQGEFEGEMAGTPFEGISYVGFDIARQRYVGMWMDSMGTGMMPVSEGQCSSGGKVITMTREMFDPYHGGQVKVRDVTRIQDDDHHTFEMFMTPPGGAEYRNLSVAYTRIR